MPNEVILPGGKHVECPRRIAGLERDPRGFPVPWNVLRGVENAPIFIVNDDRQHLRAMREDLCPVCGERMGRWHWWAGGPRNAFHEYGWYLDLWMHRECMTFALQACPYLSHPHYGTAMDNVPVAKLEPKQRILLDQTINPERPDLFVAVCSDRAEVQDNGPVALPYTRPVRPYVEQQFWRHGQQIPAHRAMPILRGIFGADWELPKLREE